MKKVIYALMIASIMTFGLSAYSAGVSGSLAQELVRLHIVANSDSERDQALKLKVRDRILRVSSENFASKEDAARSLLSYTELAKDELRKNGCDLNVTSEYGKFYFPTKRYDNLSLPAGEYDAVRIVIGEGEGQNWWCVLFPPLCYTDAATDGSDLIRSYVSRDEYALLTAAKTDGAVPVKIKFKIVEWFGEIKGKTVQKSATR